MVNHVEKVIPGTVFTKMMLEMDDTSIGEHTIEMTNKDILHDTAWITNFFLSIMIVIPVSALLLFGVYAGFGKTMSLHAWNITKIIFITAAIIISLSLWIFLAVKVSVENKKRKYVEEHRGNGNWRLVDEVKWNNFYRLLMVAKNQRESEKIIK